MALPPAKRIRDLLETRVGREVTLEPSVPLQASARGLTFGIYVDTRLATRAVVVADLPAAAYLGAAAALVPLGVATSAIDQLVLPSLIADPFRGVLTDMASLFADPGADVVRLYDAVLPGHRPPADVVSLTAAPGRRLDLSVAVRAYGRGHLSVVLGR